MISRKGGLKFKNKNKDDKPGLNWAKLSSSWNWDLRHLRFAALDL